MFHEGLFDRYTFDTGNPMATINVTNYSVCAGGGHIHFNHQTDGGSVLTDQMDETQTMSPLTDEEKASLVKLSIRAFAVGKTWVQVKAAVQSNMTFKV